MRMLGGSSRLDVVLVDGVSSQGIPYMYGNC